MVEKTNIQTSIKIPIELSKATANQIAEDLIDFIIERTSTGKGKDGKSFPSYSKSYKESLDFKIAGKGSTVDLVLTGEMLDSLKVIKAESGEVIIGYDSDDEVAGRVEGNTIGSYGGSAKKSRARNFLGLSDKEISNVLKDYPLDRINKMLRNTEASELARLIGEDLVDDLEF